MTPKQAMAARKLLGYSRERLAGEIGMEIRTVVAFEQKSRSIRPSTIVRLRNALEAAGVEFIEQNGSEPGVRLRSIAP